MLAGALVGAQVGLEGIPRSFITGLRDAQRCLALPAELEQWAVRQENAFFEKPILNSPYAYPQCHWELDAQGQPTQRIIDNRRKAEFISPHRWPV